MSRNPQFGSDRAHRRWSRQVARREVPESLLTRIRANYHLPRWAGAVRHRLGNGRVHAGNAWYRLAGRRLSGQRQQIRNWRNRRTLERGRRPRTTRAADAIRSRAPVYRDRVNRGTGRPHRDDRYMGVVSDEGLAKMKAGRERSPDAYRSGTTPLPARAREALPRTRTGRSR